MVVALYVDPEGVYSTLPGVDCWGVERDARRYAGPWPVVAHPPCARWSIVTQVLRPATVGLDDGCFAAALTAVRQWGGVLEHPALTAAWRAFGLPKATWGYWNRSLLDPGWATCIWQGAYGYFAPKATWLYYVGENAPPPMDWRALDPGGRVESCRPGSDTLRRKMREATPLALARVLAAMAAGCRGEG